MQNFHNLTFYDLIQVVDKKKIIEQMVSKSNTLFVKYKLDANENYFMMPVD